MTCQTVTENEVRKRTEDHVEAIVLGNRNQKYFMNSIRPIDHDHNHFFQVINTNFSGKMVSNVTNSSRGVKRISFELNEQENEDATAYNMPKTEISRKSKYKKSGKYSKRNGKFYSTHIQKQRRLKTKEIDVIGKETSDEEKRRKIIHQKLTSFINPVFTEEEERDINERADIYSSTMLPNERYFSLQDKNKDAGSCDSESLAEATDFVYSKMVQKKKRRSYSNIDRFVTHHSDDEYSDNAQILPEGTKLLKPPSKLVELVAQSIDGSPDGMLQVQQIYTVLQNKFPYFRYMDKAAISSWRSSVRHALYQKWFQKIKFNLESINSKGCFWSINYSLSPSEWAVSQSPACRLKNFCIPRAAPKLTNNDVHEQAAMITAMSEYNSDHLSETEELKDVAQIANEYGITFSEPNPDVRDEHLPHLNIPSPVKDPDPMLIACVPDWNKTPRSKSNCFLDGSRVTLNCLSPYGCSSACEAFQTPPCSPSPEWELSPNEFSLFSPLHISLSNGILVFPDQAHTPKAAGTLNDLVF